MEIQAEKVHAAPLHLLPWFLLSLKYFSQKRNSLLALSQAASNFERCSLELTSNRSTKDLCYGKKIVDIWAINGKKYLYKRSVHISKRDFLVDSQLEVDNQINISFVRRSSLFNVQSLSKKNQNQNVKRETKPNFP